MAKGKNKQVRGFRSGQMLTLQDSGKGGGEGKIYQVLEDDALVAKIYHPHKRRPDQLLKLQAMLNNPPIDPGGDTPSIAWPTDLVGLPDHPEQVLGFVMPRVDQVRPLHHFYTPKTRRAEILGFTYHYLLRMARNLAAIFHAVHERGYVIGDVNESNILASSSTLVTLVDTDSFQVPDGKRTYRCGVGKPEFTPPELHGKNLNHIDRTPIHDGFGLAVLIFQLLMEGTHPFDGVYTGRGDPPLKNQRIVAGHFPYGRRRSPYKPKPIAPAFTTLDPQLQGLFRRTFEDGHRNPGDRPDAQGWVNALEAAEARLTTCGVNDRHVYHSHQSRCPWCDRAQQFKGRDPFPSRDAVRKGDHRKPVRQEKKRPRTVVYGSPSLKLPLMGGNQMGGVPIPTLQQLPAPNARLYWLAPGYSRKATIVSLVGLSACIIIPSLIIINRDNLNFATPGIPDRIPNGVASPPSPIPLPVLQGAIAQFPATQRQLVQLVDQTTAQLSRELVEELAGRSPSRPQLRQQVIVTLKQLLKLPPNSADLFLNTDSGAPLAPVSVGDRQTWVQGLHTYQGSRRIDPPLPKTGQFDPKGRTRASLEQDIKQMLLVALKSRPSAADSTLFPNQH
ncbi:MAG: hypothetical protein AAGA67_04645 [Cyanobacteria bacterium P01_F01_bin.153]